MTNKSKTNKKFILFIFFLLQINLLKGQDSLQNPKQSLGVHYFGEMGLHPGFEIDYWFPLSKRQRWNAAKSKIWAFYPNFQLAAAYYYLPKHTHNWLFAPTIAYQFRFINAKTSKYWFVEPYAKAGYLRYNVVGTIYKTTSTGFEETPWGGGNAFIFGSGIHVGGSLRRNRAEWLIGTEYFPEIATGSLFIHHMAVKMGGRILINSK